MDLDVRKNALVRKKLIRWYTQHGRTFSWRTTTDAYKILIAEILLRRTTASAVSRIYSDFINRFDTPQRLATARESTIAKSLISLGLQSIRAKQLKKAATIIVNDYDGITPRFHEELLSLPGVGNYIASAVQNFAFRERIPLVDGNVVHFLSRVFDVHFVGPSDKKAWEYTDRFGGSHKSELYWGIIDLVATVCLKQNPRCSICPLSKTCKWFASN
ncbi:MAG: hypothetical protein ACFFFK_10320 [Candidatus Thorarchaeota archaeon]